MALKLIAELGGDGSGFERMMGKAGMTAKRFGAGVISPLKGLIAGAFTVGAISSLTKGTVEWASKLRDVADQLGVNVEWLQKMQNGAKLVGADIDDIGKFIMEMNKARQDSLQNPKGTNAKAFQRLGVSPQDQQNLSTQAFFDKLVSSFNGGANTQLVNDIQEVGGRSARNLIAAFSAQFASDTPILAEQLIDQLDDIGDEFTIMKQVLMVELAPAILAVSNALRSMVGYLKQVGTMLGAMTSNITLADIAKSLVPGFQGQADLAKKLAGNFDDASRQTISEANNQESQQDVIEAARQQARDARKRREQSAPQFDPLAIASKTKATGAPDALVKVGNFLGQAPGTVNAIAEKQLTIQTKQLKVTEDMARNIHTLVSKLPSAFGGGMSIPAN